MDNQSDLLERLWTEIINGNLDARYPGRLSASARRGKGDQPFADVGPALKRVLKAGVDAEDLCRIVRLERYEAVFGALVMLEEAGAIDCLHESILSADPSGLEGRPGSWPIGRKTPAATVLKDVDGPVLRLKKAHCLALSPNGALVVAADNGAVTDTATGKEIAKCKFPGHTSTVAFSPRGNLVAATSTDGTIAVCDVRTGEQLTKVKMKAEGCGATFSADGKLLFAGDWDGNVWAWNLKGSVKGHWTYDDAMITRVDVVADGRVAVNVCPRSSAPFCVLWDAALTKEIGRVKASQGTQGIALNPVNDR